MENRNNQILLAKILGEIYRLQKYSQTISCPASDSHIYGLLNGFERSVNEELESIGFVLETELSAVERILDEYFLNEEKFKQFQGYYDIERELEAKGIDRGKAITILKYLKADNRFERVIARMNSSHSPGECKTFALDEFDR